MREIIFVTGGQRSGKSNYAQGLAESISAHPFYLATARKGDSNFEKRIERHQLDRGEKWQTLEIDKRIGKVNLEGKTVLLDCITLWLTNIFHDNRYIVVPFPYIDFQKEVVALVIFSVVFCTIKVLPFLVPFH